MNLLSRIETIGNRLPDPATLFLIGTVLVFIVSGLVALLGWNVESPLGETLQANNLLSANGIWWLLSNMVDNFIRFPPLGIVLVGMLGIGLAESSGLLPVLLRAVTAHTPQVLLTPAMVFIGIMSSMALDAGYVVLPPVAAVLYLSAGRPPLAGIAAAFAGVSAGFSANLLITAVDPLLAGFTQSAATIIDPDYQVAVTANWWFMLVSTPLLTLAGWAVTAWYVEPRLKQESFGQEPLPASAGINRFQDKGLLNAILAGIVIVVITMYMIFVPGAPLSGKGTHFARWIEATVPLLFIFFFIPGIVYGITAGTIRNDRDAARILGETIARLGPYIVLAFFAAQFIESFKYSHLGEMLAISGGEALANLDTGSPLLLSGFIVMVILANLLIGSASAKYALMAPVFVPMLMLTGISPELTQAAYRVGDSVSNVITPLNPYMIIILAEVKRYSKDSGLGTVVAMMLPYTVIFALLWSLLLVAWVILGLPPGPGATLHFAL